MVAVDVSEITARYARSMGIYNGGVVTGDFVTTGHRDVLARSLGKFDTVTAIGVACSFGDLGLLLSKIRGVLKTGGVLVLDIMVHETKGWQDGAAPEDRGAFELDRNGEWFHMVSHINDAIWANGFVVVRKLANWNQATSNEPFKRCFMIYTLKKLE